jgi:NADPH:quinone reductase-like Zn-dependent oxidoreductase
MGSSVGDVTAQLGMWWLIWGCSGTVGNLVAQLGMW